jgi:hypothetical protein
LLGQSVLQMKEQHDDKDFITDVTTQKNYYEIIGSLPTEMPFRKVHNVNELAMFGLYSIVYCCFGLYRSWSTGRGNSLLQMPLLSLGGLLVNGRLFSTLWTDGLKP